MDETFHPYCDKNLSAVKLDLQKLLNLTLYPKQSLIIYLTLKYFKCQSDIGQLAHLKCQILS